MKKQSNVKSCWIKEPSIFHDPNISNILTMKEYIALPRCLHITNPVAYVSYRALWSNDKMGQVR
jgi:hypothetical protein